MGWGELFPLTFILFVFVRRVSCGKQFSSRVTKWSRAAFNPQAATEVKWIRDNHLVPGEPAEGVDNGGVWVNLVKNFLEASNGIKDEVQSAFAAKRDAHFRLAADICGMTRPDPICADGLKIREGKHMAKSIEDNCGDENIRRLCWILYFSPNAAYKQLYGKDMGEYYEQMIMQEMNVEYDASKSKKTERGCVSQHLNKMINRYRSNVTDLIFRSAKSKIARVCTNEPKEWESEGSVRPEVKSPHHHFWVGTRDGFKDVIQKDGRVKRVVKVKWDWVSLWGHDDPLAAVYIVMLILVPACWNGCSVSA
jgi:hypothetical protein